MAPEKLFAEWFWVDRWMGSSAFGLNIAARGLYREMLSQAWLRGAQLPNDHEQIRRFTGVTNAEWRQSWRFVERFWTVDGDVLINETQVKVYAEAKAATERASLRGRAGAHAKHKHNPSAAQAPPQAPAQAPPEHKPPVSVSERSSDTEHPKNGSRAREARTGSGVFGSDLPRAHLRHNACGRVCLHEDQAAEFTRKLGGDSGVAARAVHAWAVDVLAEWDAPPKLSRSIGGTNFQFWAARWEEWQGPAAKASRQAGSGISGTTCVHTPRCTSSQACIAKTLEEGRAAS